MTFALDVSPLRLRELADDSEGPDLNVWIMDAKQGLREAADALERPRDDRRFLIWSHEHHAWWRPAREGYTTDVDAAGQYTAEEAADITLDHFPSGEEVAVRAEVARRHGPCVVWGHEEDA